MTDKKKNPYGTTWEKPPVLLPLGGGWAFGVGIIVDAKGGRKVRLVKGKLNKDKPGGISQVQKMNIKSRKQWAVILSTMDAAFDQLEGGPPAAQAS